jgi:hypothetical protein
MIASDFSPMTLAIVAMCGGSPAADPDDEPTSTGFSCNDYNLMIKAELAVGNDCSYDSECSQVLEVDDACPTADRVLNGDFEARYLLEFIDEAEAEGCTVEYGARGDCDPDALPVCEAGNCTWL